MFYLPGLIASRLEHSSPCSLDFLPRFSRFAKSLGFGQGNYKRLKDYFEHLLSSYNDLATGIGTKMQKRVRQRVCLYGAHALMGKIEK